MTPIYFPFTWVDTSTVQVITAVFPKIVIYQPLNGRASSWLRPFEQAGNLEIRIPVTEDSKKLELLVLDYQNWARFHQGGDLMFLKTRQSDVPFINALSSRIKSDILHYQDPQADPTPDPIFGARLFLEIAWTYDAQQAELNCDLAKIQNLEKRFMTALGDNTEMNEPVSIGSQPLFQDVPGDFMVAERLQAWSLLVLQDRQQHTADGLWITSRISVIEWIQDQIGMEQVLEINCVPIQKAIDDGTRFWQESIVTYLSQLQTAPWPSAIKKFEPPSSDYAWENAVSIKGFIIPNLKTAAFLQKLAADKHVRMPDPDQPRNTLIMCITPI